MNHHPRQDPNPFESSIESSIAGLAIGDSFEELLKDWTIGATANSGRAETAALKSITRRLDSSLGGFRTDDITPLLVKAYALARTDAGLAPRTVGNQLRVLRRVFTHGMRCGVATSNPALGVKVPEPTPADIAKLKIVRKRNPKNGRSRRSATQARPTKSPKSAASNPKRPALNPNSQGALPKPLNANPTVRPKPEGNEPKPPRSIAAGWEFIPIGCPWCSTPRGHDDGR